MTVGDGYNRRLALQRQNRGEYKGKRAFKENSANQELIIRQIASLDEGIKFQFAQLKTKCAGVKKIEQIAQNTL